MSFVPALISQHKSRRFSQEICFPNSPILLEICAAMKLTFLFKTVCTIGSIAILQRSKA
ncbi:MAG: hypothetical protein WBA41_28935 [Rivularia sp. (in: cyanobacteria)]